MNNVALFRPHLSSFDKYRLKIQRYQKTNKSEIEMSHNHGHSHGPGGCDHGKSGLSGEEFGIQYSLYQKIDSVNVTCLNEEIDNSGKDVFKSWTERKNREKVILQIHAFLDMKDGNFNFKLL